MYKRLGANEILKKPFDPDVAVALVTKATSGPAPRD